MATSCFCMIAGKRGNSFHVNFDSGQLVSDLQYTIMKENPTTMNCSPENMRLFLAKHKDGTWLEINKGGDSKDFVEMDPKIPLLDNKYFGDNFQPKTGQVHVLVVVKEDTNATEPMGMNRNSTENWQELFRTKRLYYPLPSLNLLRDFIKQPLAVKIHLPSALLASWSQVSLSKDILKDMFEIVDENSLDSFTTEMLARCMTVVVENPKDFNWFYNTMIGSVLEHVLFPSGFSNREPNRTFTKRPNVLFNAYGVCLFRGEEKDPNVENDLEFSSPLAWIFGEHIPYMFGSVASGYHINLLCFHCPKGESRVKSYVIGHFNLAGLEERLRFVLALMNLCRFFPALGELCPSSGYDEYVDLGVNAGVRVQINPTCIDKIFQDDRGFDRLEQIYRVMEAANVRNVDRLVELNRTIKTAVFQPRGIYDRWLEFGSQPLKLLHLFIALRNVLKALVILHQESVMHRDMRWPNVIRRCDRIEWFLIDFSDAAISPQDYNTSWHLSPNEHAPEVSEPDSIHTTAVDIWSVGYLLWSSCIESKWNNMAERKAFTYRLMHKDPLARPTAEEALRVLVEFERTEKEKILREEEMEEDDEIEEPKQKKSKVAST